MSDFNLEREINQVQNWVVIAGKSLAGFYKNDEGIFFRNSQKIGKKLTNNKSKYPTSTNRSFVALLDYLRFLYEEDLEGESVTGELNNVRNILDGVVSKYFTLDQQKLRYSGTNNKNSFTDSHLLISIACLDTYKNYSENVPIKMKALRGKLTKPANLIMQELSNKQGISMGDDQEIHDFLSLHAIKGVDSYNKDLLKKEINALRSRVKETVLRSLAYHYSGISSKFDPIELTFSISLLNRLGASDNIQLTYRAIKSIVNSQASDGAWPTTRLISYEAPNQVHIASYEVALTLANLLIRKLMEGDLETFSLLHPALKKSFELIKYNYTILNNASGWVNDHTRKKNIVESWTTAIVLSFLIRYQDALQYFRHQQVLEKYNPIFDIRPKSINDEYPWPDMAPVLRKDLSIDQDILIKISDPSEGSKIKEGIEKHFLNPIKSSWINRPENSSVIFYGPPGTRKTSLAILIGKAINWPIIIFSPPHFLRKGGLEGFESSADDIFSDLSKMRRVVVLFDECEEFFKKRLKNDQPGNRTIGAFITAGMLPRLQMLKEKKWILFILGTNIDIEELDPAVIRKGRFDYAVKIGHPVLSAQTDYIDKKMDNIDQRQFIKNILIDHNDKEIKKKCKDLCDVISFSFIDEIIKEVKILQSKGIDVKEKEVKNLFRKGLENTGLKSLTD